MSKAKYICQLYGLIVLILPLNIVCSAANAEDMRLEGLLGWGHLDAKGSLTADNVQYNLDGLGGGGVTAGAALWKDFNYNLSLGIEYNYSINSITGSTQNGTTTSNGQIDLSKNSLLFNALWRRNSSDVHPFIGGGIGLSRINLETETTTTETLPTNSTTTVKFSDTQTAPVFHGLAGFDYDIDDQFYWGIVARYEYVPVELIDTDLRLRNMSISAKVGMKF